MIPRHRSRLAGLAATLAATVLLQLALPAGAADPPTREQVERRHASVATLIESSSGAKQIESSGNPEARAQRAKARELHAAAGAALAAGDLAGATKLLDEAAKAMFDGVRHAAPEQVTRNKERADFDARMESTRALADAQKRIAAEKGGGPRAADLTRRLEELMKQAGDLANGGKVAEGRQVLDQAYLAAKAAIGGLRGGDTLVKSLQFTDKAEEYRYEVDRNDTHQMLVKVLLQDRQRTAAVDAMVEQSLADAARLRRAAEDAAARRDFDAGVKRLEESTRELVRAIRGAGVYIPG